MPGTPPLSDRVIRTDFAAVPADRRAMLTPSRARRALSVRQLNRRKRVMTGVKLALPMLALALLALLLLWPEFEGQDGRLSFRRGPSLVPEALQVVAPRYQGADDLGRPYTITALTARQVGQEEILLLTVPSADILLTDGAWVFIESRDGRYDKAAQRLDLVGDVRIFHDGGTLFVTEAAAVQLDAGTASGTRPTEAQGSFGTIVSEGFEMRDRGAVMIFTGRARAVLEGRQQ